MTRPLIRQRAFHFKNTRPGDPRLIPFAGWRPENRAFYREFREWLKSGGYSDNVIATYSVPVRLALSLLDKPHPDIDPITDLEQVRAYLRFRCCPATCVTYHKGLAKLAHYLRWRGGLPALSPAIHVAQRPQNRRSSPPVAGGFGFTRPAGADRAIEGA